MFRKTSSLHVEIGRFISSSRMASQDSNPTQACAPVRVSRPLSNARIMAAAAAAGTFGPAFFSASKDQREIVGRSCPSRPDACTNMPPRSEPNGARSPAMTRSGRANGRSDLISFHLTKRLSAERPRCIGASSSPARNNALRWMGKFFGNRSRSGVSQRETHRAPSPGMTSLRTPDQPKSCCHWPLSNTRVGCPA